jgi:hypothetical protein
VLDEPVTEIALDKPPHVAALGKASVFARTNKGFQQQALPRGLLDAPGLQLKVFYGRDYRVRVVGTRSAASGTESVYLRSLPGGLKPAPAELGQLGNSHAGPLVAVLGTDDPEVVCRPGALCLIKRLSGWAKLSAPAEVTHAAISDGQGWIVAGKQILRADRDWVPIPPAGTWNNPSGLFAVEAHLYVIEAGAKLLHVHASGAWQAFASPVGTPLSVWGATAKSLWLVGSDGVAHFDGGSFRPVDAPSGLVRVLGRGNDQLWFAGSSGLYRAGP